MVVFLIWKTLNLQFLSRPKTLMLNTIYAEITAVSVILINVTLDIWFSAGVAQNLDCNILYSSLFSFSGSQVDSKIER